MLRLNKKNEQEGKAPVAWDHLVTRFAALEGVGQWHDDPDLCNHVCVALPDEDIEFKQIIREAQVSLKNGQQDRTTKAKISIMADVNSKFGHLTEIEKEALKARCIGSNENLMRSLRRSRNYRFPTELKSLTDLLKDDDELSQPIRNLLLTHRGLTANPDNIIYGEKLVIYNDEDTLCMCSPRMIKLLSKSKRWFADGSYQYSPAGVAQVYRIFGMVQNRKAYPMFECIMMNKTEGHYEKIFRVLNDQFKTMNVSPSVKIALFDCELGAVNAFRTVFPKAKAKMCMFHVKQALHRMADKLDLRRSYQSDSRVEKIIRSIGAVQLLPPNLMDRALIGYKPPSDTDYYDMPDDDEDYPELVLDMNIDEIEDVPLVREPRADLPFNPVAAEPFLSSKNTSRSQVATPVDNEFPGFSQALPALSQIMPRPIGPDITPSRKRTVVIPAKSPVATTSKKVRKASTPNKKSTHLQANDLVIPPSKLVQSNIESTVASNRTKRDHTRTNFNFL
uniref:MULE transposase domain-containing protein n=2 Tax=Acrobeloides nanus TaxID=290746 RepID=A0A914D7M3_9BILA